MRLASDSRMLLGEGRLSGHDLMRAYQVSPFLAGWCTYIDDGSDAGALRMIIEALRWYVESLSTFWISLAGGGLFKLILICCLIYWICCRRGEWRCDPCRGPCPHCGCRCGHCPCGAGEDESTDESADETGNGDDAGPGATA